MCCECIHTMNTLTFILYQYLIITNSQSLTFLLLSPSSIPIHHHPSLSSLLIIPTHHQPPSPSSNTKPSYGVKAKGFKLSAANVEKLNFTKFIEHDPYQHIMKVLFGMGFYAAFCGSSEHANLTKSQIFLGPTLTTSRTLLVKTT